MAETLLALLLVTTSAKGSYLVFRWPEAPARSPRLCRPKPNDCLSLSLLDNPWRASHSQDATDKAEVLSHNDFVQNPDYCWPRPVLQDRSISFTHSTRHPVSRPARDRTTPYEKPTLSNDYDRAFGYSAEYLANLLCPQRSMCHQKFELVVDDLAFIGHPVCAEPDPDGGWRFKPEKIKTGSRGREDGDPGNSASPHMEEATPTSEPSSASKSTWLQTFHLTMVLDLPDPSSSASGNLAKYFNILYEQIAFTVTAVLYQEQVLSNFVENECDALIALKDNCFAKGEPFSKYVDRALEVSSIAAAMKTMYEAIKTSSMAYVTINNLPLELQLPPYLDTLLHSQSDQETDFFDPSDDEDSSNWGLHMTLGWKLPSMAPWKTLLLLDIDNDMDPHMILRGPHENAEDRTFAEGLVRFLEIASVTLSLFEMANLLDWDLESQVYPIVRWLVLHRRAKIVDVVHSGLKTVFALPPTFGAPLSELSAAFREAFPHPSIPPLAQILATISTSASKQTENHFFASVVKSKEKELIRMYHDVVLWMLKRDMLITLHLRIRIVATLELKRRVKEQRESKMTRKSGKISPVGRIHSDSDEDAYSSNDLNTTTSLFPARKPLQFSRRISSNESGRSEISELNFQEEDIIDRLDIPNDSVSSNSEPDEDDSGWDTTEDHLGPSMINDPGKATPMQRRWLSAMSDGIEPAIAKRFELINQYFDGKRSDDEILYRADISRRQLREVLHHYDDYLQTFLHSA